MMVEPRPREAWVRWHGRPMAVHETGFGECDRHEG